MRYFKPGDLVCLKDRFSPEMMLIEENDGRGTVVWQDATGKAVTEEYPFTSLKSITLSSSRVTESVMRFDNLMRSLPAKT